MTTDPDGLSRLQLRVLLAVWFLAKRHAPVTLKAVCGMVGHKSNAAVWSRLMELRDAGLVTWQTGQHGTLRPTCEVTFEARRGAGASTLPPPASCGGRR